MKHWHPLLMLVALAVLIFSSAAAFGSSQSDCVTNCDSSSVRIHDIQGPGQESRLDGYYVSKVPGIVTAINKPSKKSNGFFIQDNNSDCSNATSEALYVFTEDEVPDVNKSDFVLVSGDVSEFKDDDGLGVTEITRPKFTIVSSKVPLPAATILGIGGRIPPDVVIDDDNLGEFDPDNDGTDFFESLEGMRVQINDAVVVGPSKNKMIFVLADNGTGSSIRSARGGILLRPGNSNPEIIGVYYNESSKTNINVSDRLKDPIIGILKYYSGNYEVEVDKISNITSGNLTPEIADNASDEELTIATYNVENLSPEPKNKAKFDRLAKQITSNLKLPDIIVLEEIGDNNGAGDKGEKKVVCADVTYELLINSIKNVSGKNYTCVNIDPLFDQDGGAGAINIRAILLYRTDIGLELVECPEGDATNATTIIKDSNNNKPHLSYNPGRIDPMNEAFDNNRKPLAAEFIYNNATLFVIANHLKSKGEDQSLYGDNQPPKKPTENQRHKQARVIKGFVDEILKADPNANIVVLGDLNDFQFSETLSILKGDDLSDVIEGLAPEEQYSYIYQGNSQALDHILLTENLYNNATYMDVVHINSEFADRVSDHDPVVVHIKAGWARG